MVQSRRVGATSRKRVSDMRRATWIGIASLALLSPGFAPHNPAGDITGAEIDAIVPIASCASAEPRSVGGSTRRWEAAG